MALRLLLACVGAALLPAASATSKPHVIFALIDGALSKRCLRAVLPASATSRAVALSPTWALT